MKVTGFTIIKNAIKFDFPIKEAILSILPLCDEVIVAVGDCTDGTRELVQNIHATKIKIIDTVWDVTKNTGGIVLADETNKAFTAIDVDTDWCVYIQGDEVLYEDGIEAIKLAMLKYKNDKNVDGLLLNYLHFYGSYDYVAASSNWYRKEIRIIKNDKSFFSYKDAQGFRKGDNKKLCVKQVNATMYHYGWVKEPKVMMDKVFLTGTLWAASNYNEEKKKNQHLVEFDYGKIDVLKKFASSHPKVMLQKIKEKNWKFEYDLTYNKTSIKERFKNFMYKLTGREIFMYKNYKLV